MIRASERWRDFASIVSPEEFNSTLNTFRITEEAQICGKGKIREFFFKEIEFELSRILDISHKLDDEMRDHITYVLTGNFDGPGLDMNLTDPSPADHERWENNLRKFMQTVFAFIQNPCEETYTKAYFSDPQSNGEYV